MKLYEFLAYDRPRFVQFLTEVGLLRASLCCPKCKSSIKRDDRTMLFRCRRSLGKGRRCTFVQGVRTGTWFSQSRLSLETICRFTAYFVKLNTSPRQLFLQDEFDMSSRTAPHWISRCRQVCLRWCRSNKNDLVLGGAGKTVEIDEMKLGHRKYHRGRVIDGKWLFGAYERESGRLFIIPVDDRTVKTLIPLINRHIAPRTTIMSDCWRGYGPLRRDPTYEYLSVNHSKNFVHPRTGAHTQHIERVWRDVRDSLPRYGCTRANMMEYLAEYIFRREVPLSRRIRTFFEIIVSNTEEGDADLSTTVGVFSHHKTMIIASDETNEDETNEDES